MAIYCGYCALVGRPNVGKSTLLNRLVGAKLSITSRRPQTTRVNTLGIASWGDNQALFIDTPGLNRARPDARSRAYNSAAQEALQQADVLLAVLEHRRYTGLDADIFQALAHARAKPMILLLNKYDRWQRSDEVEQVSAERQEQARALGFSFAACLAVSARSGYQLEACKDALAALLPTSAQFLYPEHVQTDQSLEARARELIREQLMRQMGDELPYQVQVRVEPEVSWERGEQLTSINADLLCPRAGQKAMLIGQRGARIKQLGSKAREQLEQLLGTKVMLRLRVRVDK